MLDISGMVFIVQQSIVCPVIMAIRCSIMFSLLVTLCISTCTLCVLCTIVVHVVLQMDWVRYSTENICGCALSAKS